MPGFRRTPKNHAASASSSTNVLSFAFTIWARKTSYPYVIAIISSYANRSQFIPIITSSLMPFRSNSVSKDTPKMPLSGFTNILDGYATVARPHPSELVMVEMRGFEPRSSRHPIDWFTIILWTLSGRLFYL